jgi:hypothetical protein
MDQTLFKCNETEFKIQIENQQKAMEIYHSHKENETLNDNIEEIVLNVLTESFECLKSNELFILNFKLNKVSLTVLDIYIFKPKI